MNQLTVEKLMSSWVLPCGNIIEVPGERHDEWLPDEYNTVALAEKSCIRVSCCWGYTAPISEIHLPKHITRNQAELLKRLNDQLLLEGTSGIEHKLKSYPYYTDWDDVMCAIK